MARSKVVKIYRHMSKHLKDNQNKIVVVTGARQSGKTFLCMNEAKPDVVLNLDLPEDRKTFKNYQLLPEGPPKGKLFVDEIHKMRGWRNTLKGYFDKFKRTKYIVSGSSAFELLLGQRGDSLAGRTLTLRLEPVTFREYLRTFLNEKKLPQAIDLTGNVESYLRKNVEKVKSIPDIDKHWEKYYSLGGYPELLSKGDLSYRSIWLREYMNALLGRDLRDLESAKDTERVEQTFMLLLESIGSTYSLRKIAQTLQTHPNTIKSDILALKKLLWGIELTPCKSSVKKRILKEKKFYPVDWILAGYSSDIEKGYVFENAIVNLIHRHLNYDNFKRFPILTMGYFKNYNKEEIDVVIQNKISTLCTIEIKTKAKHEDLSKLKRLSDQIKSPVKIMVTNKKGVYEIYKDDIFHISADYFALMLL